MTKFLYDGEMFDTLQEACQAVIDLNSYKAPDALLDEVCKIEEISERELMRINLNTKEG